MGDPSATLQRRSKLTELQTAEMIKTAAQVGEGEGDECGVSLGGGAC